MITAEKLAKLFHETYQHLAPEFEWSSDVTHCPWYLLPTNNRNLMIATAEVVLTELYDKHGLHWDQAMIPMPTEDER